MLSAESPAGGHDPEPEFASRIMSQKFGFGRLVLPSNGENVQGQAARQGHHALVQLRKVREQGRRDEGVGKQEQKGVAGVVVIVIG